MPAPEVKEITLRRIILTAKHYILMGLRGWLLMLVGAILLGAYFTWSAYTTPVYYESKVSFVVNNNSSPAPAGLGGVLGQLSLGGGGQTSNMHRILSFIKSRQLLTEVLLDSTTVNGVSDLGANHLIDVAELVELYDLDPVNGTVRLSSGHLDSLSRKERSLVKLLYSYLSFGADQPMKASINEITNVLSIWIKTRDEDLSLWLSENIFEHLTEFYTAEATAPARFSVERLESKADSVLTELNRNEYSLAKFQDTRLSLTNQRDRIQELQLRRNVTILGGAYGETIRNLEAARFSLDATTPYFKMVEAPFTPLNRKQKDPIEQAVYGLIIGGLIGFLLAAGIAFFKDVMAGREVPDEFPSGNGR